MIDLSKYKALFLSETQEHLQSMNDCLLKMEKGEQDDETISAIFRNAHSIKGMAASMGYEPIRDLAHSMEDLLDQVRQKQRTLDKETTDILFQAADRIEEMLKQIEKDRDIESGWQEIQKKILELIKKKPIEKSPEPAEPKAPLPISAHPKGIEIQVLISPEADSPSVRALILFKRIQELGKIFSASPSLEEIKSGKIQATSQGYPLSILIQTERSEDEIREVLKGVSELTKFEVKETSESAAVASVIKAPETKQEPREAEPASMGSPVGQTVRIRTQILDDLINTLGELILIKGELEELSRRSPVPGLRQSLDKIERLSREFHDQVMSARLVPIEIAVQRLPRLVRDLAKEYGKEIELEIKGKEIELDRTLIEKLMDPLVHIIRNAVYHGIESPEERKARGKNVAGKIRIIASRERDIVDLTISDDGRGIDPQKVKKKALEMGLISPAQAEEMTMEQCLNLVFISGLSTADKVGMVSGRGVGMEVVKNMVEGVGGTVILNSEPGRGTTISLQLPRTVAITKVLLIKLAEEIFAFPLSRILRTIEILPYQLRKSQNQEYYLEKQELIPLVYFHKLLDLKVPEEHIFPLNDLVVEGRKKKMALVVDALVGQEDAFIRPLGKPLERIPGLSGVTMLGDGRIVFVLELVGLF